jgi:ankyrin repeat protein
MSTIHDLVRSGALEAVQTYIATGGDINITDKLHRTPLHLAAWTANPELLSLLLKSKADVDKKAIDNFTILHFVVQSNNPSRDQVLSCIRMIVRKAKHLLNQRISKGNKSALHLAVVKGHVDTVRCLLECGLDKDAKMSNGQLAVDLAKSSEMTSLLNTFDLTSCTTAPSAGVDKHSSTDEVDDKPKEVSDDSTHPNQSLAVDRSTGKRPRCEEEAQQVTSASASCD